MTDKTVPYSADGGAAHHIRPSRVLRRIRDGKVARVLKLNTTDAIVAEIFAQSGVDAIWLCMEHVPMDFTQAAHAVRAAKIHDVDTLIRVSRGGYADYVRALEIDAAGLIVPHVMDEADARMVRDYTKFAPVGNRAADGGNADAAYTRVGLVDYMQEANKERLICHQIEDPSAVDDLDKIAEMDGVDALFFGPGDYSIALGIPGQINAPEVEAVRRQVAETARKHGKVAATVCGQADIARYADLGYNLLSVGADVVALRQYAEAAVTAFGDL